MSYRFAICDDDQDYARYLEGLAAAWAQGAGTALEVERFPSAQAFLFRYEERRDFDVLLLDIEMDGMDGVELAKAVRRENDDIQIVFVTGYTDHVFDGYSVGALGYLMKPPRPEQLDGVLDRGLEARLREEDKVFLCRSGETVYRISKRSIRYFVSDRRQVSCVAASRTYTFYGKLDEVERAVGGDFIRIHQRYLVRAGAVDRLEGGQVFVGEEALPVSRACRSAALAALARTALEG